MAVRRDVHAHEDSRGYVVDEHVERHADAAASEHEVNTVRVDGYSLMRSWMTTFNGLVALLLLTLEALLTFRLIFALAGANPGNGFVEFIYDVTGPFVAPFENIAEEQVDGSSVFEPETLIAMGVYAVGVLLFLAFVNIVTSAPAPTRTEAVTRERHVHYDSES